MSKKKKDIELIPFTPLKQYVKVNVIHDGNGNIISLDFTNIETPDVTKNLTLGQHEPRGTNTPKTANNT